MRLGIDASNLRSEGGVTHLVELLRHADPTELGIEEVIVWTGKSLAEILPREPWLSVKIQSFLNHSLPFRIFWQMLIGPARMERSCDVMFVPGTIWGNCRLPVIAMAQNMLPFEPAEIRRYGMSWMRLKLHLLRSAQLSGLRRADAIVYLTEYNQKKLVPQIGKKGKSKIIPHGLSDAFRHIPRPQRSISEYSAHRPFQWLYVSTIDMYKHQWNVVEAVSQLRHEGLPVFLHLVGGAYGPARRRLMKALRQHDPDGQFTKYSGNCPYSEVPSLYKGADAFVFASSCENLSKVIQEAMGAGLPMACSSYGSMPEVAGDAAVYFDPEKPDQIAQAMRQLLCDVKLRERLAQLAYEKSLTYSWGRCANETLGLAVDVLRAKRVPI
jgi:glycosyltransferase involved in cell wall biosynthesis